MPVQQRSRVVGEAGRHSSSMCRENRARAFGWSSLMWVVFAGAAWFALQAAVTDPVEASHALHLGAAVVLAGYGLRCRHRARNEIGRASCRARV